MKKSVIISLLFTITFLFLINAASAANVAYIYKDIKKVDVGFIDEFEKHGFNVHFFQEKHIPSDLSSFDIVFLGNERYSRYTNIHVEKYPTMVSNYPNVRMWGLANRRGASKLNGNSPLKVQKDNLIIQVYTKARDPVNKVMRIPYLYLAERNKIDVSHKQVGTYAERIGGKDLGDVISYIETGSTLSNNKITKSNICFFGLIKSQYWTAEAKQMFSDCIDFINQSSKSQTIHDVALVDFTNSIGGIRLELPNGTDILGNELNCNQKYKIGIKVKNLGNVQEDVTFHGNINGLEFEHFPKTDLQPNSSSTKTKTVNFSLGTGVYTITAIAHIQDIDLNPLNNMAHREITINCDNPTLPPHPDPPNLIHDISLINFTNSFGNIRLEHKNGTDILENEVLTCNTEYKIGIKVKNNGNFSENITYSGSIIYTDTTVDFMHNPTTNLPPGSTSTKTKTVNFNLPEGPHSITVEAHLPPEFQDAMLNDNSAHRTINILCDNFIAP